MKKQVKQNFSTTILSHLSFYSYNLQVNPTISLYSDRNEYMKQLDIDSSKKKNGVLISTP